MIRLVGHLCPRGAQHGCDPLLHATGTKQKRRASEEARRSVVFGMRGGRIDGPSRSGAAA